MLYVGYRRGSRDVTVNQDSWAVESYSAKVCYFLSVIHYIGGLIDKINIINILLLLLQDD